MTSALLEPSALSCPPRFGTPRDLSRPTLGPAVGKVARRIGKPLMEWQQYVVDVANEIDPATGQFAYDEVTLTVPRQSGKTTLILSRATHRCSATSFFGPRQHVTYTAQTRKDARQKFVEEFIPDLEASPTFATRAVPHLGNGDEHIRYKNRSRFGIEATTEKSGHGPVLDEAFLDEAFAQVDSRVEDAASPAMITRRNSMLWVVSTAGWKDKSPYLLDKVTVGREYVLSGEPGRLAYFEWSAHEDDDPEDEAVWWLCMPALGITVSVDKIRSELQKAQRAGKISQFQRPYLNQWVLKDEAGEAKVDPEAWRKLEHKGEVRPRPVAFSVVVSDDGKWSSICLAGRLPDGRAHLQVVKTGRGTSWVVDELVRLDRRWKPGWIAVAPSQRAGSLIGAIESARLPLLKVAPQELAQACGQLEDGVAGGTVAHTGQPQVTKALGSAGDRKTANKTWTWKALDETDISPLWGLTIALFGLSKPPKRRRTGGVGSVR